GVLCNFIVCVGAYVGMKMQDDTAKTIIMMIVVMAFVLPGFEHSIANMGYFTLGITGLGTSFDWSLLPLHMLIATVGNIVGGGVLLGLPLYMMIKPKK
ncbi:MAG: formate/nitrite transporter family protein, partial [Thomasclavelia spiroformis]